jgi:hypothetical protein
MNTIKASFTTDDVSAKSFAITIQVNGAKHVTYQNSNMSPPIHETAFRAINYVYWSDIYNFPYSWTIEGIIKSPEGGSIQIGVGADDRTDLYLFGDTTPTISATWPTVVYKSFDVTLGQDIPFFMNNYNTGWSALVNLYYKGADNVEKKFDLSHTFYFSGITSSSPWDLQDYIPAFTASADLSFKEIVYSGCDRIYSDLAIKNKFWPSLCAYHYVSSALIKCQICVDNSSHIGYSCKCDYGYYEKVSTNSCISTNPILVYLNMVSSTLGDVMILVISNPCTIDDASYCKETGQSRYLTKPSHTIFTSDLVNSRLQAEDYIDPDGTYTIFINTLKSGGMVIKCFSNTSFGGAPIYEATNSTINHSFSGPELYNKPTSCMIYGYFGVGLSSYHKFYIQGSDTVTSYINDSRITTHNTSEAEVSYSEYYEAPSYIPIKIEIINTLKSLDISFELDIGNGRYQIPSAGLFSPTRALGKIWDINPNVQYLYIENNIQFCDETCNSCNLNLDGTSTCLTCIDNASVIGSLCICNNNYYYDSISSSCLICPTYCTRCTDATTCTSCQDRYYLESSTNTCLPCGINCSSCSDGICLECDSSLIAKDGECVCDAGLILSSDQTQCIQLINGCEEYDASNSILCIACRVGLILETNKCVCELGKYYDQIAEVCLDCPSNCSKCSLVSDIIECTACTEGSSLLNSSCICNGEFYYDEDLNICLPYLSTCKRFYLEGRNLLCEDCKENAVSFEGVCMCKDGYYLDSESYICKDCDEICLVCEKTKTEACLECISTCESKEAPESDLDSDSNQSQDSNNQSTISKTDTYEYRQAKRVSKKISTVSTSISSSALAFGSITFNLDKAWSLINLMEIYSIIPLLQVDLPIMLDESLKSQGGMSFMPDLVSYLFDYEYEGSKVYSKAYDYKYKTPLLILNLGKTLLTFIILVSLNIILYLGTKLFKGKLQKVCVTALSYFRWKVFIRFYIQVYLELCILSILNLVYVRST